MMNRIPGSELDTLLKEVRGYMDLETMRARALAALAEHVENGDLAQGDQPVGRPLETDEDLVWLAPGFCTDAYEIQAR